MMRAVKRHTKDRWVILYIERWLKASVQLQDGGQQATEKGTPQGGLCKALHKPPYAKLSIMQSN